MRPILHHYPNSPFAEKIRTLFGFKRIEWTSVQIPPIMPKPDVVALTGGYRKTPVLQLGADIYCDTALIAKVLERLAPVPALFPAQYAGLAAIVAQWADSTVFWTAVPYSMQPAGFAHMFAGVPPEVQKAFADDRALFRGGVPRMRGAESAQGMKLYLSELEALLQDGRPWLLGPVACIADFSVYHCLWFVSRSGPFATVLEAYPKVHSWFARVKLIGHGTSDTLTSGEAVKLASESKAAPVSAENFIDTHRLPFGSAVVIAAVDYGTEPTAGELVISLPDEVAVRRTDARAGTVVVHFPRIGYEVRKAE
jgi:glutathione S-transferase